MSLIICPECEGKVSDKADLCPHCGYLINKKVQKLYNVRFGKAASKVKAISKICQITNMSIEDIKKLVDNNDIIISNIDIITAKDIKNTLQRDNVEVLIEDNNDLEIQKFHDSPININLPKCPMCGSTDISKISTLNRSASIMGFGIFSKKIGKQWQCNNPKCKHLW